MNFSKNIGKNYAFDLCLFNKSKSNYIFTMIDGSVLLTKRGDHSPAISIYFVLLNMVIIDFNYYNIHHEELDEE